MAPGSDPYATPVQRRVDALLCIFIVVVIALVLRTSAHGQDTLPGFISVAPQPFWSTVGFFHVEPKVPLVVMVPAFLNEGQPDYAAANGADSSAFAAPIDNAPSNAGEPNSSFVGSSGAESREDATQPVNAGAPSKALPIFVRSDVEDVKTKTSDTTTAGLRAPDAVTGASKDFFQNLAMTSAANYTPFGLPTNSDDVRITTTSGTSLAITSASIVMESLNVTNGNSYTINNATSTTTSRTLTLGNSSGFTNVFSGVANDLIFLSGSSNLTISATNTGGGTGTLGLVLASSGNLNIGISSTLTVSSIISGGSQSLTKTGSGTAILSGANTYTGGTIINGGILTLGNATNTLADTGAVTVGGGTLAIGANSDTVGTVSLTSGSITGSTGTLTGSSYTVQSGSISARLGGSASLTKTTSGTVTLSGANTYSGTTTINGGTLQAGVGSLVSVGNGVTVNSGGTLLLSGTGRHLGNAVGVTLNGGTFNTGGLSEPGGTPGSQNIGALTLTSTSTIDFGAGNLSVLEFGGVGTHTAGTMLQIINWDGVPVVGGSGDRLLFNGLATTFSGAYNQSDVSFNGMSGYLAVQFDLSGPNPYFEITSLTAVPEPSTWAAGFLAMSAVACAQRRRLASKRRKAGISG